jgi:hypothetical protein
MSYAVMVFALAAALEPSALRLLPPDAGFLLGVDVRPVLSSVGGGVLEKHLTQSGMPQISGLANLEKTLREDVDSVLLVGSAKDFGPGSKQAQPLVIVRGRFERDSLRRWLRAKVELYKTVEVFIPTNLKPPTTRIALLDSGVLLFGDRRQVLAAIDRHSATRTQVPARLVQRAEALASRHHIWLAVEAPPGGFPSGQGPQAKIAEQLTGLDVGVSFGEGVNLEANLEARSETAARDLAAAVQGLIAMGAMTQADSPGAAEMLRKLQVTPGPTSVGIRLALTKAELEQSMTQRAQAGSGTAPARPAARPAQPAKPREPGKIRILGLDSGPREIPVR